MSRDIYYIHEKNVEPLGTNVHLGTNVSPGGGGGGEYNMQNVLTYTCMPGIYIFIMNNRLIYTVFYMYTFKICKHQRYVRVCLPLHVKDVKSNNMAYLGTCSYVMY